MPNWRSFRWMSKSGLAWARRRWLRIFVPEHAYQNGSDPTATFIKAYQPVVVNQAFSACIGWDGAGLAGDPLQDSLLSAGVFQAALSCFSSPPSCVWGFLAFEPPDGFIELLHSRCPNVGGAVISETGSLSTSVGKEFLPGGFPLWDSRWEGRRGSELPPSFRVVPGTRLGRALG